MIWLLSVKMAGLAVYHEKVMYQNYFDQNLVREIAECIYNREGSEFTCSTKDFYYIKPKTEHFRDLMLHVVGNVCMEIQSFNEIKEPCMKLAVYEQGGLQEDTIYYWRERFGDRCYSCNIRDSMGGFYSFYNK